MNENNWQFERRHFNFAFLISIPLYFLDGVKFGHFEVIHSSIQSLD